MLNSMRKLLLVALIMISEWCSGQCMSGTYTIGGTTPDYATINSAVAALQTNGVCGPVVMNIRNGNYTEQLQISGISGTSSVNTVTFQSESGDSSQVTIMYTGTSSNPHVIRVGSCQYIRFSKIGVRNNSPSYTNCITVRDSADHIAVSNCHLYAAMLSSNNQVLGLYYVSDYRCDSLTIRNSRLEGANIGITTANTSPGYLQMNIEGNTFLSQERHGLYIYKAQKCVLRRNTVVGGSANTGFAGFYLNGHTDSLTIENNKVVNTPSGILLFHCSGFSAGAIRVVNNMTQTTNGAGISIGGSSGGVDVFHNSCVCTGIFASSSAFICNTTSLVQNRICNNVFAETGGGVCYYYLSGNNISECNVLWVTGSSFGIYQSVFIGTIGEWRNLTGYDMNSVFNSPQFVSSTDLHVAADFSANVSSFPGTGVSTDFDGDPRNPVAYPGADESVRIPVNVDITPLTFFPTGSGVCDGTQPLWVIVRNSGTVPVDSFFVEWSINNVAQSQVQWTGNLLPWDTVHVYVGTMTTMIGVVDTLDAWTSFPNGGSDDIVTNDSDAHAEPLVLYGGVYTIGGVSPDFPTIGAAVTALQATGVCGPVTLNIRDGIYTEQVDASYITGMSAVNTVTFTSESQDSSLVVIDFTSTTFGNNYVLRVLNQPYFIFDRLTFNQHGNSTHCRTIWLQATRTLLTNCHIKSDATGVDEANGSVVSGGSYDTLTTIQNCWIEGGFNGIAIAGVSNNRCYKMKISNCVFSGQSDRCIVARQQDKLTIEYNLIGDSSVVMQSPLYCEDLGDSCTIAYNTIVGHHLSGLSITDCISYPSPTLIANNMIAVGDQSTSSPLTRVAFAISNASNVHIISNSFSTYSLTNNVMDRACNISGDSARVVVRNNILSSRGLGKPLMYGIQGPLYLQADNNAYWTEGGNVVEDYNNFYPTLGMWTQYSGNDSHSVVIDPRFVTTTDLHSQETSLIGAGVYDPRIVTDIDGELRNNPPTIGADEFAAQPDDAGVYEVSLSHPICPGTVQIPVVVKNYGTTAITSFDVYVDSNNVAFDTINWTGMLLPGDTVVLYTSTMTFISAQSYSFEAYTSDPNMVSDNVPMNDTGFASAAGVGLSGTYVIGGATPDYLTINSAIADLMLYGACSSVEFLISNGTYNEQSVIGGFGLASSSDTVVFRSLSGDSSLVTWSYVPAIFDGTLSLANTHNLRIYDLTISAAGLYNPNPVEVYGNCSNVVFGNCAFNAPIGGASAAMSVNANFFGKIDSLRIQNCLFSGGDWGVHIDAQVNQQAHVVIRNNVFDNNESGGMWLHSLDTSYITGNSLVNQQGLSTWEGINVSWSGDGVTIDGNMIDARDGKGIYLWTGMQSPGGITMVRNNFVHSRQICVSGINAGDVSFCYNTLRCYGPNPALAYGSGNSTVYGNILLTASQYWVFATDTALLDTCDYNVFYATDTMMVLTTDGNYDFTEWQDSSGRDMNSQFLVPFYNDSLSPHLSQTNAIENMVPLAGAVFDIDGDARGPMSDPGADENIYSSSNSLVFPGNANNDSIVDAIDVLVIGLYNGATGIPRTTQGNVWAPHVATDWQQLQNNNQDMKHGDCNGDGTIDLSDTNAIVQNFGFTEYFPIAPYPDQYRSGIPVQLVFAMANYTAGSWVTADIVVGDSASGPFSVYGIACAFKLPPGSYVPGSVSIVPDANWMTTIPTNGFAFAVCDSNGMASLGITRHDHVDASGYGVIGHLSFQIPPTAFGGTMVVTSVYDTAVVANGTGVELGGAGGVFLISGVEESAVVNDVLMYPNPTSGIVNVQFNLAEQSDVKISIKDASGRVVREYSQAKGAQGLNVVALPLNALPEGIYFLELSAGDATVVRPLSVMGH